ncbi:MAG: hypothetical protein AAFX81_14465 [Pseudomonadota bacterium]
MTRPPTPNTETPPTGPDTGQGFREDASRVPLEPPAPFVGEADNESRYIFVKMLYAKISHKVDAPIEDQVQQELGELLRLIAALPESVLMRKRADLEIVFDLLASRQPNLKLIKSLRSGIETAAEKSGWLSGVIVRIAGTTPLQAVVSALITVFFMAFVVVLLLLFAHRLLISLAEGIAPPGGAIELPELSGIKNFPIREFLLAIHASFFGSIVSIVTRMERFLDNATYNVVVIYVSILSKPFVSATFAVFVLACMEAGLVSFAGFHLAGPTAPYLAWVIGFMCGFSERIAQDFASKAANPLGEEASLPPRK